MAVVKFYGLKRPVSSDEGDGESSITESQQTAVSDPPPSRSSSSAKPCILKLGTKKRLFEPESVYKLFPRQQKAIEFARNSIQNVAVFAFESEEFGSKGQRRFVATTYYEFGKRYLTKKCAKHFYEVIVEGTSDTGGVACRLYFDIEFKREFNPNTDALLLLEIFIQYICYQLHSMYHVTCNRSNIVDLDSSTPEKFSRHLIFHMPLAVFRNNILVGQFVRCICDQLRSFSCLVERGVDREDAYRQTYTRERDRRDPPCPSGESLLRLFVRDKEGRKVLICDEAVYTRNRNFRLYLSSKLGKSAAVLKVAKENKFKSSYCESSTRRRWSKRFNALMDSLVCNVSFQTAQQLKILPTADTSHDGKDRPSSKHRGSTNVVGGDVPTKSREAAGLDSETGFNHSPFPSVDAFITNTLTKGGTQGSIRRWTYFPEGKSVLYDIQHYRWCENIGRAHKSNNIMIVADLSNGVYYQKCHDPDCRRVNFRSNEIPIPLECNPVLSQAARKTTSIGESEGLEIYVGDITQQDMEQIEEEDWTGLLEENEPTSSEAAFQFGDVSLEEIEQFEKVDSDIERDEEQQLEVPLDKRDTTVEGLKESDRTTEHLKTPSLSDDDDAKVDRLLMEALKDYETQLSPIGD